MMSDETTAGGDAGRPAESPQALLVGELERRGVRINGSYLTAEEP